MKKLLLGLFILGSVSFGYDIKTEYEIDAKYGSSVKTMKMVATEMKPYVRTSKRYDLIPEQIPDSMKEAWKKYAVKPHGFWINDGSEYNSMYKGHMYDYDIADNIRFYGKLEDKSVGAFSSSLLANLSEQEAVDVLQQMADYAWYKGMSFHIDGKLIFMGGEMR